MTMIIEGGIMGPMIDEEAVTAAAKALSYPCFFMAGINMEPRAAISPNATPVIPANNIEAMILTCANPPRQRPTSKLAKSTIRSAILPRVMISPARIKKGMHMRTKASMPAKSFWGAMSRKFAWGEKMR